MCLIEVLKFGSYIVDALREYRQPVTVYIPPKGEIRGGAWVVLDTLINPDFIEMYASESARGGVLEANATAGLKFRGANLNALMNRIAEVLIDLAKQEQTTAVKQAMKKCQTFLRRLYRGVLFSFLECLAPFFCLGLRLNLQTCTIGLSECLQKMQCGIWFLGSTRGGISIGDFAEIFTYSGYLTA